MINLFFPMAVFFLLSCPISGHSTPVITEVTGDFANEKNVRIIGSGFGWKNPAPPLIWADFEKGKIQPSPLGQRKNWNAVQDLEMTRANQAPGSRFNVVGIWNARAGKRSFSFRVDKKYWTRIYHFQKRLFTFDATRNQKFWRLWSEGGGNSFLASWESSGGRCYNEIEGGVGGKIGGYQGSSLGKNEWHYEEFIWQHSGGTGLNKDGSPGKGTGIWDYTVNGERIQHRENVVNGPANHTHLRTDNFTDGRNLARDGDRVYMDDIYIDDTYARVMIGDAPTMSRSRRREMQIPSAWSEESITITFNQGGFAAGQQVYLFVYDRDGRVNRTGYPIRIGG